MSRPMTLAEFADVLNHVQKFNAPLANRVAGVPVVKYIDPCIDMRSNTVFSIGFRGFGSGDYLFHCQNEQRDRKESLYERCMDFLTTGKHH